jgi:[ribosomal protein S5]-alanine N-acetyltransferase
MTMSRSRRDPVAADGDWSINTPRTTIRPAAVVDAPALHQCRGQMPFDRQTRTLAETRRLIAAMDRRPMRDAAGWQQFAVLAPGAGRFLGDIGINFDTPRNRQAEIGFAFAPEARGQGLASEAVAAMVERLFASGRRRLVAQTDMRNVAAQRLLARLRFRREAVYRQSWEEDGHWFDEVGYARLADE